MSDTTALPIEDRHAILAEIEDLVRHEYDASLLFERLGQGFEYSDGRQFYVAEEIAHFFIADQTGKIHWITPEARSFLVDLGQKPTLTLRDSQAHYPNSRVAQFIPSLNTELLLQQPRQEVADRWRNHMLSLKGELEPQQAVEAINESATEFGYTKQQVWAFLSDLLQTSDKELSFCYHLPSSSIRSLQAFSRKPKDKPDEIGIQRAAAKIYALHSHSDFEEMVPHFATIASALHHGEDWISRADDINLGETLFRIIPYCETLNLEKKRTELIRGCTLILGEMEALSNHKSLKVFAKLNNVLEQHDLGGPLSPEERQKAISDIDEIPF